MRKKLLKIAKPNKKTAILGSKSIIVGDLKFPLADKVSWVSSMGSIFLK